MAEVTAWQARPLEPMYPVVFFDALRVKIREDAVVRNKAIYLALGVLPGGTRDILGLWIEGTEGAKFCMKVFNDLKTPGVHDILIIVTPRWLEGSSRTQRSFWGGACRERARSASAGQFFELPAGPSTLYAGA